MRERPAVVDCDFDAAAAPAVGDLQPGAEGQGAMSGGEFVRIVLHAGGGAAMIVLVVIGGDAGELALRFFGGKSGAAGDDQRQRQSGRSPHAQHLVAPIARS